MQGSNTANGIPRLFTTLPHFYACFPSSRNVT